MAAQLALYEPKRGRMDTPRQRPPEPASPRSEPASPLCASCRAREARYGFQHDGDDPQVGRPRTLCFECFRLEMGRRQEAARAIQARLPLEHRLEAISRRRRRAQIAARKALGL